MRFEMSDEERELRSLMIEISDLIEKVEEQNMPAFLFSDQQNEFSMLGYKRCLRDLAQRVHEVFWSDTERMQDLGFEVENPDLLIQ
jgi:hypothetical protein